MESNDRIVAVTAVQLLCSCRTFLEVILRRELSLTKN